MAIRKYVTQSKIDYYEAMLQSDRFHLLNMSSEGIWLVDNEHPQFDDIKETAISIARTYGDNEELEKLKKL